MASVDVVEIAHILRSSLDNSARAQLLGLFECLDRQRHYSSLVVSTPVLTASDGGTPTRRSTNGCASHGVGFRSSGSQIERASRLLMNSTSCGIAGPPCCTRTQAEAPTRQDLVR